MKTFNKLLFTVIPVIVFLSFLAISACNSAGTPATETKKKKSIVFLITKDTNNYEADRTIPQFAELLEKEHDYETTVLLGTGSHGDYKYPNVDAIADADLLVVFARRIALPADQMNAIKNYVNQGKPVIGIRTAHHAFEVLNEKIQEGHEDWPSFTADILGCKNKGYGPQEKGYNVTVVPSASEHPILKDVELSNWHSNGSIYHVELLDKDATVLLQGEIDGKTEPIAWTRNTGKNKVFYISMGYPDDFNTSHFKKMLINGFEWAL